MLYTRKKQTNSYEITFVATRGGGGRRNWMKAVKRYKMPVIMKISSRDAVYNTINQWTLLNVTYKNC